MTVKGSWARLIAWLGACGATAGAIGTRLGGLL
jgi:hypothetical protein